MDPGQKEIKMSLYWSIFLFNLRVSHCVSNFPFSLIPFSVEQKTEFCIDINLDADRRERNGI